MAFFRASHLFYTYEEEGGGGRPALRDLSFEIERGSFVVLLGHNGSGKSTLAKLLNLLLFPTSGQLFLDGKDVTSDNLTEEELTEVRRQVGMVFQNPDNQLVATVVEEDIAFGPENLGVPPAEIRRRVDAAMDLFGIREYARHAPSKLSGGQKQRVAIAGIVAMEPSCVILDEATAMLDPQGRSEVMEAIGTLHHKGITVLHITHNMEEALGADRVLVLDDGALAMDGTPREVFSQAGRLREMGLSLPQPGQLLDALNREGFSFPTGDCDPESVAALLYSAIRSA